MFNFALSSIHLDSTFAKRNQNLMILTTFVQILGNECVETTSNRTLYICSLIILTLLKYAFLF